MELYKLAFATQIRAIYAIVMRELQTRFGEKKIGFFWSVIEAIAHVSVFAVIKHFIGYSGPDGINVILFLITGIIPFFYFRNIIGRMLTALTANRNLLTVPQISFIDFYYARLGVETFLVLVNLPIVMLLGVILINNIDFYYYTHYEINDIFLVLHGLFLLGIFGLGCGLIVSAISAAFEPFALVSNVVIRFAYFTSGVIFAVDHRIPYRFHELLSWNPIVHAMEYLRAGFFKAYTPEPIFMNSNYVMLLSLILIFIGLLLVFRMKSWVLR